MSERERRDGNEREAGILRNMPRRAKILQQVFERREGSQTPGTFFD